MESKINIFRLACGNSGGQFGGILEYTNKDNIKSDKVVRVQSYAESLKRAIDGAHDRYRVELDEFGTLGWNMHEVNAMCSKVDATFDEFVKAYTKQTTSWQDSLDGKQPKKNRNTVKVQSTARGIEVLQISACGNMLNIKAVPADTELQKVKRISKYEEHNKLQPMYNRGRTRPKTGPGRVADKLRKMFIDRRTYSLGYRMVGVERGVGQLQPTFRQFVIGGVVILPEDISPMLDELRSQKQTA